MPTALLIFPLFIFPDLSGYSILIAFKYSIIYLFKTDIEKEITVDVNRDPNHFEDIFMLAEGNYGLKDFNSKNMSSCQSLSYTVKLYNTTLVTIRTKKLDERSNVSIKIRQALVVKHYPLPIMILIFSMIAMVTCAFLISFTYTVVKHRSSLKFWNTHNQMSINKIASLRTSKVMNSMAHGTYKSQVLKFSEQACPICLEFYKPISYVHVINEWNHWVHSKCLKRFLKQVLLFL